MQKLFLFYNIDEYYTIIFMITLEEMLNASVHLGHPVKQWNPKMSPFIYGERNGIHLIDVVQTIICLSKANDFLLKAAKDKKTLEIIKY